MIYINIMIFISFKNYDMRAIRAYRCSCELNKSFSNRKERQEGNTLANAVTIVTCSQRHTSEQFQNSKRRPFKSNKPL